MEKNLIIGDISQIGALECQVCGKLGHMLLTASAGSIKNSNLLHYLLIITTRHLCQRWLLHHALPLALAGTLIKVQQSSYS